MPETWLSPRAAAGYLGISPRYLYKLKAHDKNFPVPSPLGRCPRYAASELDAYMLSKRPTQPKPDPELEREAAEIIRSHRGRNK